jgi:putative endonuclease
MALNWLSKGRGAPQHPTGANAEAMAEAFLRKQGLKLLARNVSCPQGEIDLIMQDGETLVFVEVRFRKQSQFGSAAETVTASKQRKLVLAAQHYLSRHRSAQNRAMRFDVMGIMPSAVGEYDYNWLQNAFYGDVN